MTHLQHYTRKLVLQERGIE